MTLILALIFNIIAFVVFSVDIITVLGDDTTVISDYAFWLIVWNIVTLTIAFIAVMRARHELNNRMINIVEEDE